jgi:hypothetical protein
MDSGDGPALMPCLLAAAAAASAAAVDEREPKLALPTPLLLGLLLVRLTLSVVACRRELIKDV